MNTSRLRIRRLGATLFIGLCIISAIVANREMWQPNVPATVISDNASNSAEHALSTIQIKGRAPKTGYARSQFGDGWEITNGCDTRNIILRRDMKQVIVGDKCKVMSGILDDPYTGKTIVFKRGAESSADVQIDHVVALSDAWQKGAQQLSKELRIALANDPLELLAVDGQANQDKSDGDAASWLPPNKAFRCQYVARQVAVKSKYQLWMTQAEFNVVRSLLERCPRQSLPSA